MSEEQMQAKEEEATHVVELVRVDKCIPGNALTLLLRLLSDLLTSLLPDLTHLEVLVLRRAPAARVAPGQLTLDALPQPEGRCRHDTLFIQII